MTNEELANKLGKLAATEFAWRIPESDLVSEAARRLLALERELTVCRAVTTLCCEKNAAPQVTKGGEASSPAPAVAALSPLTKEIIAALAPRTSDVPMHAGMAAAESELERVFSDAMKQPELGKAYCACGVDPCCPCLKATQDENQQLRDMLWECVCGFHDIDGRIRYVEVQIDKDEMREIYKMLGKPPPEFK